MGVACSPLVKIRSIHYGFNECTISSLIPVIMSCKCLICGKHEKPQVDIMNKITMRKNIFNYSSEKTSKVFYTHMTCVHPML